MDYNKIKKIVKKMVSEKRYKHCLRTSETARALAQVYKIDETQAELTALAHDIAKGKTDYKLACYIKDNNLNLTPEDEELPKIWHQIVGADLVQKLGFTEEMVKAVRYHTTGRAQMGMLEKIIFISDKIEPERDYPEVEEIRKVVFEDIDLAIFLYATRASSQTKKKHSDTFLMIQEIESNLISHGKIK